MILRNCRSTIRHRRVGNRRERPPNR
jgi:hypothetical protein